MCECVASGVYLIVCVYVCMRLRNFSSQYFQSLAISFFARRFFLVGFSFYSTVYACFFPNYFVRLLFKQGNYDKKLISGMEIIIGTVKKVNVPSKKTLFTRHGARNGMPIPSSRWLQTALTTK